MDATLFTSNGGVQTVTNNDLGTSGFKPDLVWTKSRTTTDGNDLNDSVRGASKYLISFSTAAETTDANFITAFNSNGFSLGTGNYSNGQSIVGWQWQAGQGTTSSNTSGTITSTVSVNTTAGFSIVTWTSAGANATIGHGLGAVPSMIIVKARNAAYNWATYHVSMGNGGGMYLNLTNAYGADTALWQNTTPTSSVFSVGTNANVSNSSQTQVAYCWTPIPGYSQFGSYTGNGSTDGPFVYTGFRPKFVMIKGSSGLTNAASWDLFDTSRNPYNLTNLVMLANSAGADNTDVYSYIDILSNGFKNRSIDTYGINQSGATYIYAAFAENPFKYANAR